jgi:hypothetical protein
LIIACVTDRRRNSFLGGCARPATRVGTGARIAGRACDHTGLRSAILVGAQPRCERLQMTDNALQMLKKSTETSPSSPLVERNSHVMQFTLFLAEF